MKIKDPNLVKALVRNGKELTDFEYIYLLGKEMTKEKEEHQKGPYKNIPFSKEGYDAEMIEFSINVAKAYDTGENTREELEQYIKNSIIA